ncbi:MAG: guanylate kinase [Candidatus Ratteibacteria bacterium]|nr:guanylate kinase [Candidatus Ratteibacteria bacterium]
MKKEREASALILILSAPSGAGKTTLCQKLAERNPHLYFSVSYTTRLPRPEEKDGHDYFFISREEFLKKIKGNFFAEWAEVHGALYGTSGDSLNKAIKNSQDVVLNIDVQGALQIKKKYPEAVSVFIVSPVFGDLKERLKKRKTETGEDIEKRLRHAKKEIAQSGQYDYKITNRKLEEALGELEEKITFEKSKPNR